MTRRNMVTKRIDIEVKMMAIKPKIEDMVIEIEAISNVTNMARDAVIEENAAGVVDTATTIVEVATKISTKKDMAGVNVTTTIDATKGLITTIEIMIDTMRTVVRMTSMGIDRDTDKAANTTLLTRLRLTWHLIIDSSMRKTLNSS